MVRRDVWMWLFPENLADFELLNHSMGNGFRVFVCRQLRFLNEALVGVWRNSIVGHVEGTMPFWNRFDIFQHINVDWIPVRFGGKFSAKLGAISKIDNSSILKLQHRVDEAEALPGFQHCAHDCKARG